MTLKKFLKITCLVFSVMFVVNSAGALYFYQRFSSGQIQETTSDGHKGWEFFEDNLPVIKKNSAGLRDHQDLSEIQKDSRAKVIFLGNSVVYGVGMPQEKTFPEVTQQLLGNRVRVINAGIEAIEIWREFSFYERELASLKPRLVIWFPNRNDFVWKDSVPDKIEEAAKQNQLTHEFNPRVFIRPEFFRKISQKIYFEHSVMAENFFSSPHNQYYTDGITFTPQDTLIQQLDEELQRFQAQLKKQNTDMLVIFLPSRIYAKMYGWEQARSFQAIAQILDKNQIPYEQLLDHFHQQCDMSCFIDYVHLSTNGHQFLAESLAKTLQQRYSF